MALHGRSPRTARKRNLLLAGLCPAFEKCAYLRTLFACTEKPVARNAQLHISSNMCRRSSISAHHPVTWVSSLRRWRNARPGRRSPPRCRRLSGALREADRSCIVFAAGRLRPTPSAHHAPHASHHPHQHADDSGSCGRQRSLCARTRANRSRSNRQVQR